MEALKTIGRVQCDLQLSAVHCYISLLTLVLTVYFTELYTISTKTRHVLTADAKFFCARML